jgi:hypothetical protein
MGNSQWRITTRILARPQMFIDDFRSNELLHKYIDDLTVTDIFAIEEGSKMHSVLSEIQQWSVSNLLNVNIDKTKQMLVCSANRVRIERLKINNIIIQFAIV